MHSHSYFLFYISVLIKEVLDLDQEIQELSKELHLKKSLLVMGRGFNFATCLEGALVKIYWICYRSGSNLHSALGFLHAKNISISPLVFI